MSWLLSSTFCTPICTSPYTPVLYPFYLLPTREDSIYHFTTLLKRGDGEQRGHPSIHLLSISISGPCPDILVLKHGSSILRQSSNPVCGFSMMEQVTLCAVWPRENWLGSSIGWLSLKCYCHALFRKRMSVWSPLLGIAPPTKNGRFWSVSLDWRKS